MIIGLTGYARSGKDTLAGMLMGLHGYRRVAFADTIRDLLFAMDPLIMHDDLPFRLQDLVESKGWDKAKTEYPEVRRLLQDLGVGARNLLEEDIWITAALKGLNKEDRIVVTDVRFKNEAVCIKGLGGQIWRVKRFGVDAVNDHVSESSMDSYPVDQIFVNSGTPQDLMIMLRIRMDALK